LFSCLHLFQLYSCSSSALVIGHQSAESS
jgi:hypothetical protein